MNRSPWPTVRTALLLIGVPLACAMLPAIYTQNKEEAKVQREQYQHIADLLNDLKYMTGSHLAAIDQQDKDFDGRISQLEVYKPVYRK